MWARTARLKITLSAVVTAANVADATVSLELPHMEKTRVWGDGPTAGSNFLAKRFYSVCR